MTGNLRQQLDSTHHETEWVNWSAMKSHDHRSWGGRKLKNKQTNKQKIEPKVPSKKTIPNQNPPQNKQTNKWKSALEFKEKTDQGDTWQTSHLLALQQRDPMVKKIPQRTLGLFSDQITHFCTSVHKLHFSSFPPTEKASASLMFYRQTTRLTRNEADIFIIILFSCICN